MLRLKLKHVSKRGYWSFSAASVEESLFKKLDEFAQKIKDKFHPSGSEPETYGFIDDTKDFIDKIVQGETWLQAKLVRSLRRSI